MKRNKVQIGIIGGSGFYELADSLEEIKVETPFGPPSEKIAVGKINGKGVAFLSRHNKSHDIPPHAINYRANIWAFHKMGVNKIVAATACGSLKQKIKPGDFVVIDQFVDRTCGRKDSFYEGPIVTHISSAYPYCPALSRQLVKAAGKIKMKIRPKGTVVVIQGPRFSTVAESTWFAKMGWDIINMTQYPEAILARELGICYTALALVTDYDAGVLKSKKVKPVSAEMILKNFKKNANLAKKLVLETVKSDLENLKCGCADELKKARFS